MRSTCFAYTLAGGFWLALMVAGCTLPGTTGTGSSGAPSAPGFRDSTDQQPTACDPDHPQPDENDLEPIIQQEYEALSACMQHSNSRYVHVWFVIGRDGHARDVHANGDTIGALARCVQGGLRRLVFRPPSECPTTGEFVIADSPFSRKGSGSYGWSHRPPAQAPAQAPAD